MTLGHISRLLLWVRCWESAYWSLIDVPIGTRSRLLGVVIDHMLADSSPECGVLVTAMVIVLV